MRTFALKTRKGRDSVVAITNDTACCTLQPSHSFVLNLWCSLHLLDFVQYLERRFQAMDGLMIGFVSEVIGFGVYDVYHVVPGKGSVWG